MKANRMTNCTIIDSVRRKTRPELAYRATAGLAVVAWLALAGDAFSQTTNQWAPAPVAPIVQTATPIQVWAGGNGVNTPVFAPTDLDLRLENPAGIQALNAPLATPVAPAASFTSTAPSAAPIQTPVYAPLSLASTGQAPAQRVQPGPQYAAPAQLPYGAAYPAQGYGGYGYPGQQAFGNGFGGLPFGTGFGYPGGVGGYPYGNGFGAGYPGFGTGIVPGLGGWGTPYNSYNSYTGVPIFGGAPFGFW